MKNIRITLGQDTPCYATVDIEVEDEILENEEKLKEFLIQKSRVLMNDDDVMFYPEWDFSNQRIVCVASDSLLMLENILLAPDYQNTGVLFAQAITQKNREDFFAAAESCGATRQDALDFLKKMTE
ncbi:hypothetical protein ACJU26_09615 [Acidithiobacillus sp. M4-SHS-6]|uniref:hypothetical protein n=1 Tax=Acidithiobacillus sp. M4-SHS-6 TaxID=3383024 RepID=UPI0039BE6E6B